MKIKQMALTSFIQNHKNVTCYKCGKKGHYANKCPDGDNNDEASIRSSLSNCSNNSRLIMLDGVASTMVSHYSKREA
jgi:hypothetical protein